MLERLNARAEAARPVLSRSSPRPRAAARSAAWPATTPAARARSATARWSTTCSRIDAMPRRRRALLVSAEVRQCGRRRPRRDLADLCDAAARPRRARARRDRARVPEGAAPGRRLQPRHAHRRAARRNSRASARRLGRHARAHRRALTLKLSPLPRAQGAGRRATSRRSAPRWRRRGTSCKLGPAAVELVDRTMLALGARHPALPRDARRRSLRGEPERAAARRVRRRRPRRAAGRAAAPRRAAWPTSASRTPWSTVVEPALQRAGLGGPQGRPQHHDVDEGRRKAGLLHRGLRGAARAPRRLHRRAHRACSPARHARHLVRPRLGRLPARAPDPRHEGRRRTSRRCARSPRKRCDARARATRARIRASTATGSSRSRVPRAACSARGSSRAFEEVKDAFDPDGAAQSRQDRPRRHAWTTARCSASRRATRREPLETALDWSRPGAASAGPSRCATTTAPAASSTRGTMCPSLPRDARRAAPDARARQHAAPGALGPARPRRVRLRRDGDDAGSLRLLQGLQPRMPDRRRHGAR